MKFPTPQALEKAEVSRLNILMEEAQVKNYLANNPDFLQRFRVKNPYRQDKQGQLDPAILEMISKLYT